MRRQVFEQVETTLALDTHDTVEKGEESSDTRLDMMAKRFLDQKLKDRNFDVRKDDKIAAGGSRDRKPGDCSLWRSRRQCSRQCFKHDETTEGQGRDSCHSPEKV